MNEKLVIIESINNKRFIDISSVEQCLGSDVIDIEDHTRLSYTWEKELYQSVTGAYDILSKPRKKKLFMYKSSKEITSEYNSFCLMLDFKIVRVLDYRDCELLVMCVEDIFLRNQIRKIAKDLLYDSKSMGKYIVDNLIDEQCEDFPDFADLEFNEQFKGLFPLHNELLESLLKFVIFESEIIEYAMDCIENIMKD